MEESAINTKSLKEQVYEYLRQQIHARQLQPGNAINMESFSRQLGVSKTPLRDALIQLEMEGFVIISPRRGVTVNGLSLQDIKDFYQIIGTLESTALLTSSPRLSPGEFQRMKTLNQAMAKAVIRRDFDRFYEANLEFHNTYLLPCHNQTLLKIVNNLKKRLYDFAPQKKWIKEWEESSILEHRKITELIANGQTAAAAKYIRDVHWSFKVQEKFIHRYYFPRR